MHAELRAGLRTRSSQVSSPTPRRSPPLHGPSKSICPSASSWASSPSIRYGTLLAPAVRSRLQALPAMKDDERLDAIAPYVVGSTLVACVSPWCCVGGSFAAALLLAALVYRAFDTALAHEAWAVQDHAWSFLIVSPLGALHAWSLFLLALRTCQLVTAHGVEVSAEAAAVAILLITFIQAWRILESSSTVFASVAMWAFMGVLANRPTVQMQPLYAATAFGSFILAGAVYLRLGGLLPKRFSSSTWGLTVTLPSDV